MASRYHSSFSQLKTSAGAPPSGRSGVAPKSGKPSPQKSANWPMPKPAGGAGFNKTTKVRVAKQYVTKAGIA